MDLRLFFFLKFCEEHETICFLLVDGCLTNPKFFPFRGKHSVHFFGVGNDFTFFFLFLAREVPVFEIPALLFTQMFVS